MNKSRKWLKRIAVGIGSIFVVLSILPYLIGVSKPEDLSGMGLPFNESQFENVDGVSIHYRQWLPDQPTVKGKILLIHGLGGSTFSWRNNIQALRDAGYLVVAVDLPGFGYSDRSRGIDHSQKNRSTILWGLLDMIDGDRPETAAMDWVLVGHSMGGGTAVAMTLEHPDQTKALVLVDGAVFENNPGFVSKLLIYPPLARWGQVILQNYVFQYNRIETSLASAYGRMPTPEEMKANLDPFLLPGTTYAMIDLLRTAKNETVEELNTVDVPVFAIWGSNDTWVPVEQAKRIQELLPRMKLSFIDGAVHTPMETHSEAFNQQLIRDLDELIQ